MSFFEDIQALLEPAAAGGAWYGEFPMATFAKDAESRAKPYVVWFDVISTDDVTLEGRSDLQSTHLQVDIYAPRIEDADRVCQAIDAIFGAAAQPAAMAGGPGIVAAVPLSRQGLFEPAVRLCRVLRQYSISYRNCNDMPFYQSTLYGPGVGRTFNGALALEWTHEMAVFGAGAVSADGVVEGTNDPSELAPWQEICTFSASGTDNAQASPTPPVAMHEWLRLRHRLVSLTGTGAWVQFNSTGQRQ